jgi:hypothetical protein
MVRAGGEKAVDDDAIAIMTIAIIISDEWLDSDAAINGSGWPGEYCYDVDC